MSGATLAVRCPVLERRAAQGHPVDPVLTRRDGLRRYCPIVHGRPPCCPADVTRPTVFVAATQQDQLF